MKNKRNNRMWLEMENQKQLVKLLLPIVLSAYEELRRINWSQEEVLNYILWILGLEPLSDSTRKKLNDLLDQAMMVRP